MSWSGTEPQRQGPNPSMHENSHFLKDSMEHSMSAPQKPKAVFHNFRLLN